MGKNDKQLVFETSENIEVFETFQQMNLKEELLRGKIRLIPPFKI